jgi:hypothetical protein
MKRGQPVRHPRRSRLGLRQPPAALVGNSHSGTPKKEKFEQKVTKETKTGKTKNTLIKNKQL